MKWFLTISAILAFAASMAFGYLGHDGLLVAGLVAFIALLVTANLDRISEFKASRSGIEARTREVVERAETAVSELQLLATQVAELSLSLVKRQGRWGGYSDDEQDAIRTSVLGVLAKLRLPERTIDSVLQEWHRVVEFDYSHHILGGSTIPDNAAPEVLAEWKALREGGLSNYPSPETLRTFLSKQEYMTTELEELIKDYEYYKVNRTHRRPDVWRDRENWGRLKNN